MGVSYFVDVWFVMLSVSQIGNVMNESVWFMNIYENFYSLLLGTRNSARKFVWILSQREGRIGSVQLCLLSAAYFIKVGYGNCWVWTVVTGCLKMF